MQVLRQFNYSILVILVVCATVTVFLEDHSQLVAMYGMIAIIVILNSFMEYRAERIVEGLQRKVSVRTAVIGGPKPLTPKDLALTDIAQKERPRE